ncbi:MAG: TonB family protein [Gemmatimonadetes bacterium]|nr:TonB family protein [Gemmatimonadota bacterium]
MLRIELLNPQWNFSFSCPRKARSRRNSIPPTNAEEVGQLLNRSYPSGYRDIGLDVTTVLWVFVTTDGTVGASQVLKTSGYDVFDGAAMRVAGKMGYSPAQLGDEPVAVWVNQAIHFKSAEAGQLLDAPAGGHG